MTRARLITSLTLAVASVLLAAGARAHPSWGIAVDREGQVYFSDLFRVYRIDARGRLSLVRDGRGVHTHELNVDEAGNLYGADNSYEPATQRFFSAVWRLTPAGDFSYLLPTTDDPPEGTSIWRDREGNAYHFTHYPGRELLVLKRTPGGKVSVLVGGEKAAREYRQGVPYSAGGTAFGPEGALYFTHGASLWKLPARGALAELARELPVENAAATPAGAITPTQLFGVVVDAGGNAFVADFGNRRVLKVTPDGRLVTLLRAEETWAPAGVAERGGELYVLEHGETPAHAPLGTRVRRLSQNGSVTTLASVGGDGTPRASPSSVGGAALNPAALTAEPARNISHAARNIPYVLAAALVGVFAIFVVAWFARGRGGSS